METLKRSNVKKSIIIGVVVVAIIVTCIITLTRAKYRAVASTTLIDEEVEYSLTDENLVAVYVQDDDGEGYTQQGTIPTSGYILNTSDSYCKVNGTRSDSISLSYDTSSRTLTVSPMTTEGTECYLYFDIAGTLKAAILADYEPQTSSNLSAISCSGCTADENGIYEAEDDYGTTYYYRGTVDYNWVLFAGFYWRIIRINGDSTIRLIYSGENSAEETGEGTQIDTSAFNDFVQYYQFSYHVGYTYTENQQRPTTGTSGTSSTIKEGLDAWYVTNIENKGLTKYIADSGFCGDRNMASGYDWALIGTSSTTYIYYVGYSKRSGTPTFKCYNDDVGYADLYTVDSSKGNGALDYAIGLITLDEVRYAGSYSIQTNTSYWLYTGQNYWTMSPYAFSSAYAYVGYVNGESGYLGGSSLNATLGVRPVINLSANVTISGGDGSANNPYVVMTS